MPQLPTLTVTDAQATYLLGIFGSVEGYKAWLLEQIKGRIMDTELEVAKADAQAYVEQRRQELTAALAGIS